MEVDAINALMHTARVLLHNLLIFAVNEDCRCSRMSLLKRQSVLRSLAASPLSSACHWQNSQVFTEDILYKKLQMQLTIFLVQTLLEIYLL